MLLKVIIEIWQSVGYKRRHSDFTAAENNKVPFEDSLKQCHENLAKLITLNYKMTFFYFQRCFNSYYSICGSVSKSVLMFFFVLCKVSTLENHIYYKYLYY